MLAIFTFLEAPDDLIKIIWHDGIGMSLYAKRLDRGRFLWPSPADGTRGDHRPRNWPICSTESTGGTRFGPGDLRTPGPNRVPPVNPVEHIGQLRGADRDDAIGRLRPEESAVLQSLGVERHADAVMPDDFN